MSVRTRGVRVSLGPVAIVSHHSLHSGVVATTYLHRHTDGNVRQRIHDLHAHVASSYHSFRYDLHTA